MKKLAMIITASVLLSAQAAAAPQLIRTIPNLPGAESIVFDENKGVYFVSLQAGDKPGDGSIVTLNSGYQFIATVASGLENPKGIAIKGNHLFVGDMTHLVEINLNSGQITKHQPKNAEFLNDVAIDDHGDVYVSDMFTSTIYKLAENKVTTWLNTPALENPNGLQFIDNELYIAAWGAFNDANPIEAPFGRILKVNPNTKAITTITENPLGNLDGLQIDKQSNLIVSDWKQGIVYSVTTNGKSQQIIDVPRGAGDIFYSQKENKLLIPMALEGEILEYRF